MNSPSSSGVRGDPDRACVVESAPPPSWLRIWLGSPPRSITTTMIASVPSPPPTSAPPGIRPRRSSTFSLCRRPFQRMSSTPPERVHPEGYLPGGRRGPEAGRRRGPLVQTSASGTWMGADGRPSSQAGEQGPWGVIEDVTDRREGRRRRTRGPRAGRLARAFRSAGPRRPSPYNSRGVHAPPHVRARLARHRAALDVERQERRRHGARSARAGSGSRSATGSSTRSTTRASTRPARATWA